MRLIAWLAPFLATGCIGGPQPWILVVDDAELDGAAPTGAWCDDGGPPAAAVAARLGAAVATTRLSPRTLAPAWHQPLLEADEGSYRRALRFEVRARCSSETPAGSVDVRLSRWSVDGGGVALARFGAVDRLRFHFQAPDAQSGFDDYGFPDDGYGYVGYSDDNGTWDDGSADDGWDDGASDTGGDPSGADDGSGDTGDSSGGDDGSSDDGGGAGARCRKQRVRWAPQVAQAYRASAAVAPRAPTRAFSSSRAVAAPAPMHAAAPGHAVAAPAPMAAHR